MLREMLGAICICIFASITFADNSVDQAQIDAAYAQLHAAQAAATQPAKISNAELAELKLELVRLRSEVQQLKIENTALKAKLANSQSSPMGAAQQTVTNANTLSLSQHQAVITVREAKLLPRDEAGWPKRFGNPKLGGVG